jgi:hypothetical protein
MRAKANRARGEASKDRAKNPLGTRPDFFRTRRLLAGCAWLAVAAAGVFAPPRATAQVSREYDLKAALLFHFTQFVEWPPAAFATPESPLVIGILGNDPFGGMLEQVVLGEKCGARAIRIERFHSLKEVRDCQILFVCPNERDNLERINAALRNKPILTVGEFEGFATRGGMIRMVRNPANKIALRINLNAIKAAGLTVSAKLLRVAEVVNPIED